MKCVFLLLIAYSAMAPPLISSIGDKELVDSSQLDQFKTNNLYEDILEEMNGAHLRIAASHVSLYL